MDAELPVVLKDFLRHPALANVFPELVELALPLPVFLPQEGRSARREVVHQIDEREPGRVVLGVLPQVLAQLFPFLLVDPRRGYDLLVPDHPGIRPSENVDPGTIALEASAPGRHKWTTNVALNSEGQHESVTVPALTEAPITTPSTPSVDRGADGGKQRTIGFAVGAIGIVGVTIGSIYGLRAMSRNDDSSSHCRTATLCDGDGLSLREDARRFATISTIAFVAGGVALASGAVLVLTARGPRSSVSVGVGTVPSTAATGMWLSGSW